MHLDTSNHCADFSSLKTPAIQNEYGKLMADAIKPELSFMMQNYGCMDVVREKVDRTLISHDDEMEARVLQRLKSRFPDATLLGEETMPRTIEGQKALLSSRYVLAVDPIDGTQNFAHGLPFCSCSAGLLERIDNRLVPVAGAVAFPALDVIYFTQDKTVCAKKLSSGEVTILQPKHNIADRNHMFVFTSGTRILGAPGKEVDTIVGGKSAPAARITGATSADITFTALGTFCGTITSAHIWDFAGSLAIAHALDVNFWNARTGELKASFAEEDFLLADNQSKALELCERHLVCAEMNVKPLLGFLKLASYDNKLH